MGRLLALLLCGCLLLPAAFVMAAGTDALSLSTMDHSRSQAHLSVTHQSPELTSISVESPAIVTSQHVVDYQTYQSFSIDGESPIMQQGSPEVPQVSRFYRIPNTGGADLVITNAEYDVVDNVNPLPVQPENNGFQALTRDDAVYSTDGWYPPNVAMMSDPMIMRDFRVVVVMLYPVQVNPVTHQARIYRNLSVDVVANNRPGVNELLNPRRPSGEWAPIYRSMISNLDDNALDNVTTTPGSYVIVTNTNSIVRPFADSLAEWKTRKGYKVTIFARSSWTSDQVYDSIHTAYLNADPPLEFACLMGDPGAAWGIPVDGQWGFDHRYANMTAGDNIEDIGVGRLSGGTQATMATINAKIMQYERTPHMQTGSGAADTTWYHKSFLYAGTARTVSSNWLIMRWAKDQFIQNTGVYLDTIATHSGDAVDPNLVHNEINGGIGYFLWRGTWVGGMGSNIADGTSPGGRLPITMTVTCMAGEYASSGGVDSPAEDFLCAGTATNPAGGVCGMGTSTDGTENGTNGILAAGMIYAIADAQVEHLGTAVASAKAQLYSAYGPNLLDTSPYTPAGQPIAQNFTHWFNLLGDPGLSMWTDVPDSLTVTYPPALNIGARSVDVSVHRTKDNTPVPDALVVLWKKGPDSTWVKGLTDAQGNITLPVSVNSSGGMYITVTKRNTMPYLYTIPCSQVDCMPMYSSVVLDDDNSGGTQGNGDHIMNPGEIIDLPVYIRNFGNVTQATSVSATVASTNPHVVIVSGNAGFPNIAPGDSAQSSTPFRIHVSSGMQHREQALLTITITSSAGQTTGAIPLTCYAGRALYMRQALSAPLNPGASANLSVVIMNSGSMPMNGVTGQLTPLTPFVQADVATASFGDIAAGALDSNNASAFTLTANSMTFRGLQAPMRLILTTSDGFTDTLQFIVSVGTATGSDPTGPDAYGYYAYDNTDTAYSMYPTYNYVDISANGGTLLTAPSNDPGEKTVYTANYSALHRLPFGFKFYGQVYDTLTICSNGWCAFGNQSYLDMFRHYQIPAMGAPNAMIAPFFCDLKTIGSGKGVWVLDDSQNHRCIIQWKAFAWNYSCTPEEGSSDPSHFATPLDFEVILYDTTYVPTLDGNGEVVVQYNQVTMNLNAEYCDEPAGSTIGIQKPGNVVGLQYAYQSTYSPGAATVSSGRAILFTTEARQMFGQIQGTVTDAESSQPMPGVNVAVDGFAYHATTDNAGHYSIADVLIGTYNLHATFHRFDTDSVASVTVRLDSSTIANFSMHHPLMALSVTSLQDSVSDSPGQTGFTISNPGNGLLDYSTSVYFSGGHSLNPWDSVSTVNVGQLTSDQEVWGCEFMNDTWWVSGSAGLDGHGLLYRFDRDGNYLGSVPQPSTTIAGWYDMATDGQYLYGSDSHVIYGIDATGQVRDTIPSPLSPSRAIAYDSVTQHFWIADYTSDIYEIDRSGNIVNQVPNNTGLNITGMAWYANEPNNFKLYIFSRDGSSLERVTKMIPASPFTRQTAIDLPAHSGDRVAGCTITPDWNGTLLVFAGMIRNDSAGARMTINQLVFNSSWMQVVPAAASVPGGGQQSVTVTFNPSSLASATYHVDLHVTSLVYDSTMILPVTLVVHHGATTAKSGREIPTEFALRQNYPNPFNPSTNIRYELKSAGLTRLSVYNVLGEKVTELVNTVQPAGIYEVRFDAAALPSGVYFYRLTSGSFTRSVKMVLMK